MNAPHDSVIKLSPDLPYEDGSEDRILQILLAATDRSAGSDELAEHINDWPTRYHLSRLRQNLFQPFQFTPEHRVLEIGCGTGANIRVIAETGAEVVGVEGTYVRALTARTRCEGMDNVTIYAGDANDLPDVGLFDAVLLIGVLEYSGASLGGEQGPDQLLQTARKHLKENGRLILAIENQLGLKYLLSYPEDHLGLPWIGVEGYRSANGVRTWSRAQLTELLQKNGFRNQQWFYPFPDYKLPTFVASDELFRSKQGQRLVKNVLRAPVVDYSANRSLVCDATSALQTMIDSDLGPEVSNSFLVCAGLSDSAIQLTETDQVGWLASNERKTKWRRYRAISTSEFGFTFQSSSTQIEQITEDWLSNVKESDTPAIDGTPLDEEICQSLQLSDLQRVTQLLTLYRQYLQDHSSTSHNSGNGPYSAKEYEPALPNDFLDCTPKNLLIVDGHLHFIDREWHANYSLSLEKVWIRGLLETSFDLLHKGISYPFSPNIAVIDMIVGLSQLVHVPVNRNCLNEIVASDETAFQSMVSGTNSDPQYADLVQLNLTNVIGQLPIVGQIQSLQTLSLLHEADKRRVNELEQVIADMSQSLNDAAVKTRTEIDSYQKKIANLNSVIQNHKKQEEAIRSSASYKIGNLFVRPFAFIKRSK